MNYMAYINHSRYVEYVKKRDIKMYEMKDLDSNSERANCRVRYDQDGPRQPKKYHKSRENGGAILERRIAKRQDM